MSERLLLRARHVLPVTSGPMERGQVLVEDGLIRAVGPEGSFESDAEVLDLGEALLLPGLVNAHSHIEYTLLRGFDDSMELFGWVRRLTSLKKQAMDHSDFEISALLGAVELARAGVTATGDCTDDGLAVMAALNAVGLRGRAFQEVFGPLAEDCRESLDGLAPKLDALQAAAVAGRTAVGISPHSPYTVSAALFRETARLARERGLPLAVHAAESPAETSFLASGTGPIAELYRQRGLAWSPPGAGAVEYLERLGLLELGRALELVHCVQIDAADVERLARWGVGVACCPRSNAKLGNGCFPHAALADGRLRLGLGTDSAASNNALSILEELRFAALAQRAFERDPSAAPPERLLRLATLGAAECLGLESLVGSIEVGKAADLCAFELAAPEQLGLGGALERLAFGAPLGPARLTMVAGRVLCWGGRVTSVDEPALFCEARERAARIAHRAPSVR